MASLTTANSAPRTNGVQRITWQEKLQEHCRITQIQAPVFNLMSDRRGGRTAWSSTVTIQGRCFAARYFYDGQNTNNAKEDAAEVALTALRSQGGNPTTSFAGQLYAQNSVANQPARRN
ncbi:hypothetical protein I7I53_09176 [Histoplasma capsulatum var. duboisii H88]|uniref:DRBM domain-containing protein n=1 Tax=Ajellomyces capsulatus (strain H88) TaxID=544711 RepID=A0A8A1L4T0_AJEC8|nr:hypothetical protein I7I53_09176 [Histoplasma capsulatum var. duboisii H88]